MADRFNISLRTVYRDVKALDESGVPVIGEAGTGYTIMDGYRLPPVMFTQEEASALLLGAKLAERFADGSVKKHYQAALFKIKAVLRSPDKEYVESLTEHIEILTRNAPEQDGEANQYLSTLQQSIVHKRVVGLQYQARDQEESTRRDVEPIGLVYYSAAWHLIAWCRLRQGYRDFRLSRMIAVCLREDRFDAGIHPSIRDYIQQIMKESDLREAVVHFDKGIAKYIQEQKYFSGFVSEEDLGEVISMKFLVSSFEHFARWLVMFADRARIESPDTLRHMMKDLVEKIWLRQENC
jgi:predicted DNA-binding transcriptional regulator YafY